MATRRKGDKKSGERPFYAIQERVRDGGQVRSRDERGHGSWGDGKNDKRVTIKKGITRKEGSHEIGKYQEG